MGRQCGGHQALAPSKSLASEPLPGLARPSMSRPGTCEWPLSRNWCNWGDLAQKKKTTHLQSLELSTKWRASHINSFKKKRPSMFNASALRGGRHRHTPAPCRGKCRKKLLGAWLPLWLYGNILDDTKCTPKLYPILRHPPKGSMGEQRVPQCPEIKNVFVYLTSPQLLKLSRFFYSRYFVFK